MREKRIFVSMFLFSVFMAGISFGQNCDNNWVEKASLSTGQDIYGVVYGPADDIFVAVGFTVYTSKDSLIWTVRNPGTVNMLNDVTYGNGLFVAVGAAGTVVTSPDGINWTTQAIGFVVTLNGVTYGNSQFVAVGEYNSIFTSPDGINWTRRIWGTNNFPIYQDVAWGNSQYAAVSNTGIFVSSDGYIWYQKTFSGLYYGVTYNVSYGWVAVGKTTGGSGLISTSPDGNSWTGRTSPISNPLYDVFFGDSSYHTFRYLAVGSGGAIISSPDGALWSNRTSGTSKDLFGAGFEGSQFLAVGVENILRSGPVLDVSPLVWTAPASGGSQSIDVTNSTCGGVINFSDTVDATGGWINLTGVSGSTPDSFNINATQNDSGSIRYATITIEALTNQKKVINVTQSTPLPPTPIWSLLKRITWNLGDSSRPYINNDYFDNLHVFWRDNTPGIYEIYYKKSSDSGATWFPLKRMTWNSTDSINPQFAPGSTNTLHLVWSNVISGDRKDIYYKRSIDLGTTWGLLQRLTWTSGSSASPAVAIDSGNNPHIVWYDNSQGNSEIYYKKSTNSGMTWLSSERLTWNSGSSIYPLIVIDSSLRIHIVWSDNSSGNMEIYYKRSTNLGSTWSTNQRLTWNSGESQAGGFMRDFNNFLHVVWFENTPGNDEIYYKRSTNSGVLWSAPKRLSWNPGDSKNPVIACDTSNNPAVVWFDSSTGIRQILYKRSLDGGISWLAPERLTWNFGASQYPGFVVDGSNIVHVVWEDDQAGNFEIYYKRKQ